MIPLLVLKRLANKSIKANYFVFLQLKFMLWQSKRFFSTRLFTNYWHESPHLNVIPRKSNNNGTAIRHHIFLAFDGLSLSLRSQFCCFLFEWTTARSFGMQHEVAHLGMHSTNERTWKKKRVLLTQFAVGLPPAIINRSCCRCCTVRYTIFTNYKLWLRFSILCTLVHAIEGNTEKTKRSSTSLKALFMFHFSFQFTLVAQPTHTVRAIHSRTECA